MLSEIFQTIIAYVFWEQKPSKRQTFLFYSSGFEFLPQTSEQESKTEVRKYTVKPPKDLRSRFELKMLAKEQAEEDEKERKRLNKEMEIIAVSFT